MANQKTNDIAEKNVQSSKGVAFRVAESLRMIRTNLLYTLANTDNRVVLFSSAEPSAGKSTVCSNLALIMAQSGARVLLIDADMRRPVQHRHFRMRRTDGLSKILAGMATLEECVHKQVSPNLDLLLVGSIPPNPSELLGSDRMRELLDKASEQYDYIFIDTPPICVVADALVLAPMTAGIVLVARQRQTTYDEVEECLEMVHQIDADLLGMVITDAQTEKNNYVKSYNRRYYRYANYRYGERV